MINEKLQKEKKKGIGDVMEIPAVKNIIRDMEALHLAKKGLNSRIKQVQNQFMLDIYCDDYNGKINVKYDEHACIVPKRTLELLQRAQDLQSLGNSQAAKKIWDKVMAEYGVGQVPEM
jgi:hypothetical protein